MTVSEGARMWLSNEDEKLARLLYREIWLLRENCAKKATFAIYTATTPGFIIGSNPNGIWTTECQSGKSLRTKLNPIY